MPPRRAKEPPPPTGAQAKKRKAASAAPSPPSHPRDLPFAPGDRLGSFFAQNKILAGAAEVFRKQGVESSTVEDILVASGVSRRTFYKAFANKEDVVMALHRDLTDIFLSAMRAAMQSVTTPKERIARCVDVYLLAAQRSGGLMLALQAEAQRPGKLAERRRAAIADLAALMEEGARTVGREPPDPLVLLALFTGMEAVVRALMEEGRFGEADIARVRAVMMRLAMATLAEPGDEVPPLPRAARAPDISRPLPAT